MKLQYINGWDILIKTDDDTILNIKKLNEYIDNLKESIFYIGNVFKYVNLDYCQGGCYMFSNTAFKISKNNIIDSFKFYHDKLYASEDIVISHGFKLSNIYPIHTELIQQDKNKIDDFVNKKIISCHHLNSNEMKKYHKSLKND